MLGRTHPVVAHLGCWRSGVLLPVPHKPAPVCRTAQRREPCSKSWQQPCLASSMEPFRPLLLITGSTQRSVT